MTWEIEPFSHVGPIRFGMTRTQVRRELGNAYRTFKKTKDSSVDTDAYDEFGVHIYYEADDRVQFIEFYRHTPIQIVLRKIPLFKSNYKGIVSVISGLGLPCIGDGDGYYFQDLGISLYSPDQIQLEGVGICSREHFVEYVKAMKAIAEKRRLRREKREQNPQSYPPKCF